MTAQYEKKHCEQMFIKAVDSEQTFCYTVLNKTNKRLRRRWGREGSNMNAYSTYETNYYISQNTGSHQNTGRKRKKYRITSKFRFITSMIIMIGLCVARIHCTDRTQHIRSSDETDLYRGTGIIR